MNTGSRWEAIDQSLDLNPIKMTRSAYAYKIKGRGWFFMRLGWISFLIQGVSHVFISPNHHPFREGLEFVLWIPSTQHRKQTWEGGPEQGPGQQTPGPAISATSSRKSQSQNKTSHTLIRIATIKNPNPENNKCYEDVEKLKPSCNVGGNAKWYSC